MKHLDAVDAEFTRQAPTFAESLTARCAGAVGIDFTAELLRLAGRNAAENPRAAFVRGLAEQTPFSSGSFGAAVIRLALHHFEQPSAVLIEVRRLLPTGEGLVVIDILTSSRPDESRLHNAIERLRDPSPASLLSGSGLCDEIGVAGFSIESVETWDTPRPFSDWAAIVNAPEPMESLKVVLQHLARAGQSAGIPLRERDGEVWFTYRGAMVVARAA